jgi:plasmid stabilization system protein ParE
MIAVEILPEAELDVRDGALWYEENRPHRRDAFLREYLETIHRALRFPHFAPKVRGITAPYPVRRFAFDDFPYSVIAVVLPRRFVLVAVPHDSRDKYWLDRLAKAKP